MGVSRSGYYKHLQILERSGDAEQRRKLAVAVVGSVHQKHPSHGYRWIAAYIRQNTEYDFSDGYVYKAFHYLGISSGTKHKKRYRPRKIRDKYPNLIFATWSSVDRPRQVIVSDMTSFYVGNKYYELTLYFDVFTKQILSWQLADRRGAREPYLYGLQEVLDLLDTEAAEPTYLHTDQGAVYASLAFIALASEKNIIRSMSRPGTPTDNPVNESLNGWIKEELFMDFGLGLRGNSSDIRTIIDEYVDYYNSERPCFAIGYETPDGYYSRFSLGLLQPRNTFENRFSDDSEL